MKLVDELLTPVHCQMRGASPIYQIILRSVVNNYNTKPRQTQAIIFAVSYLMYSRKKKLSVNAMMQANAGITTMDQNTLATMALTAQTSIDSDCTNAFDLFQELSEATLENALSKVNSSISAALLPIASDIATCRETIAPSTLGIRRTLSKTVEFVFIDSFKHFIILLMAIFFWALGCLYVIDNYVPPVRKAISEFFSEEKNRFFPPKPANSESPPLSQDRPK